jgi:ABC-2 type transport system ATP-binding protein
MTATAAAVISVAKLGKVFYPPGGVRELLRGRLFRAPIQALAEVSFEVAPGEVVCVMGANGAGKSTLARILGGLLLPSSGQAQVAGRDASHATSEFRRRVSYVVGDERSFHYQVSGRENLRYFAALHGLTARDAAHRAAELLEWVGLMAAADRPYKEYSRGMRQRLSIARGLLGDPAVLLLDEPSLGLDPIGARDMRRFLRDETIRAAGRSALICSNDPAEVRAMADRVLFLEGGRLRGESTPDRIEVELGL